MSKNIMFWQKENTEIVLEQDGEKETVLIDGKNVNEIKDEKYLRKNLQWILGGISDMKDSEREKVLKVIRDRVKKIEEGKEKTEEDEKNNPKNKIVKKIKERLKKGRKHESRKI